jgi:hypothetical protein
MFILDDEGPYPIKAYCIDVAVQKRTYKETVDQILNSIV